MTRCNSLTIRVFFIFTRSFFKCNHLNLKKIKFCVKWIIEFNQNYVFFVLNQHSACWCTVKWQSMTHISSTHTNTGNLLCTGVLHKHHTGSILPHAVTAGREISEDKWTDNLQPRRLSDTIRWKQCVIVSNELNSIKLTAGLEQINPRNNEACLYKCNVGGDNSRAAALETK